MVGFIEILTTKYPMAKINANFKAPAVNQKLFVNSRVFRSRFVCN